MSEQNMAEEQGDDNAEEAGQNMEEGQGDEQFNEEEIEQYMADAEEEDEADVEEEQEEDVVEEEHDEYAQSDVDDGSLSHAGRGVSDSENGDEIVDSDYAISDGDVDLLEDQIEEVVIDVKGKKAADIGASSDEEDLEMPDSDEDELKHNFNTFRPEDMHDPVFKVGQLFQSPEMLRKAIREYLNC
ncbi:histone chaperone ASF1-like [Triticum aestivum]|uniref:histone chaperone ASF1-like n=1 Tax=Triticum aestivum TaxID=4565 RepID=UPI001D0272CB|nr:histone chaperone ASF1-like [Triticum aestivum]